MYREVGGSSLSVSTDDPLGCRVDEVSVVDAKCQSYFEHMQLLVHSAECTGNCA